MSFRGLYPTSELDLPFAARAPKKVAADFGRTALGGKATPVYLAHSYPTKVPPEAIEPFIEHFTRRGDVVCDPFAGSGMTGVAARRLGRHAALSDLSPLAVHLERNVTTFCDPEDLRSAARQVLMEISSAFADWYAARCTSCGVGGRLEWLLWGDTIACPACTAPIRLWDAGFDRRAGVMSSPEMQCPTCDVRFPRRGARVLESAPVWASVSCSAGCRRQERPALHEDGAHAVRVGLEPITDWFPDIPLSRDREMYIRSALALHGIRSVSDFYTPRNLRALARLWARIQAWPDLRVRQALTFAFTNTAWHGTKMRRYNARGGQRPLTGTLYIPQMSVEVNVAGVFHRKIEQLCRFFATEVWQTDACVDARLASATNLTHLASGSVDYVFTDPPFGANIFYADCAVIAESWLGQLTDVVEEAVVNKSLGANAGGKTVADYRALMTSAFGEISRVLKKSGSATVVFQNTDPDVWQALEDSLSTAGLACRRANTLDKNQQSHKGYKGRSGSEDVASFDMILTLRHKSKNASRGLARGTGDAVALLGDHLESLPAIGASASADRQRTLPYLYSLLLQAHFNGDIGLQQRGYACVRDLCAGAFSSTGSGLWHTTASPPRARATVAKPLNSRTKLRSRQRVPIAL
jgi:hypothetical protein